MNIRRKLILGATVWPAFVWSKCLWAQSKNSGQAASTIPRIAVMLNGTTNSHGAYFDAFREGMRELGYIEGRNVVYDLRLADGRIERFPDIAREVVAQQPTIIVVAGAPATRAAKATTSTIPIVMASVGDPVGAGFIASLPRPGGNITGIAIMADSLGSKEIELLCELVPGAKRIAVLFNPQNPSYISVWKQMESAAAQLSVRLLKINVSRSDELEGGLAAVAAQRPDALLVTSDGLFTGQPRKIIAFAEQNRIPALYSNSLQVAAGGLISYASSIEWRYRKAASYVDKILKGAKPGDIPVEQPTTFELALNMKTAKALGIKIPNTVLVRADKVIE